MLLLKDNLSKILSTILIIIRIYHKSLVLFRTNDFSVLDCGSPLGKAFSLVKPYGLFWLLFLSVLLLLKHFVYQLSRCADLSLYFNQFRGRNLVVCPDDFPYNLHPGTRSITSNTFSTCHWNLNYISEHNYSKVSQFQNLT